jgi:phytol kinase
MRVNPIGWPPWVGIALIVVLLLGMLVTLRAVGRRRRWQPETLRKVAHIGLGLASLSYPFLFAQRWPVLLLGALAMGTLAAMRWLPVVHEYMGGVVHGVQRTTGGELYFPIAATVLFLVADDNAILYLIPILTLTVADAVAALIGVNYGRRHFGDTDARKSVEGSIAFFVVAFLAAHVPLLLLTNIGRAESLLIGLTMGILLMLLEAISWQGLDNLFIPLGGFLLLRAFMTLDAAALGARLSVTVVLLALVLFARRSQALGENALLAGVLVGFVAWSAGGMSWLVPPLVLFVLYNVVFPRSEQLREHPHRLLSIFGVTAGGLMWLLLTNVTGRAEFYYPYTLTFAASLCSRGINWYRDYRPKARTTEVVLASAGVSVPLFFLPFLVISGYQRVATLAALLAIVPLVIGAGLQVVLVPHVRHRPSEAYPWLTQLSISIAVSLVGLAIWHVLAARA